jgi:uncharacterized protein (TIGR03435 family)
MEEDAARLTFKNATLRHVILEAFHLEEYQLLAGPKWMDNDHFDIEGKCAAAAPMKEKLVMLQALLGERFQLKYHREAREMPGYVLMPAKTGIKVKKSAATDENSNSTSGEYMVSGTNETMSGLAAMLAWTLHRPVIDETGFKDRFDYKLNWAPAADEPTPSLFAVIQDQLGLRLEARRVPIQLLIVESAEKPAAN